MLRIFKIGGKIIENNILLEQSLNIFNKLDNKKIIVHGGGSIASSIAEKFGFESKLINGKRITDKNMLKIVIMTYAGLINKHIVSILQSIGCNAIGISGVDANLINTVKRKINNIDYGYVGDLKENSINLPLLNFFIEKNIIPVICSITHDGNGNILNTNADNIASYIAITMSKKNKVHLHYAFEKQGILFDLYNNKYLNKITEKIYKDLKNKKIINKGMINKIDSAFKSLKSGVYKVTIGLSKGILDSDMSTLLCI